MPQYEITFITKDEKNQSIVKETLEKYKAKILAEESLGRKAFVYPIKKENAEYYFTFYFNLDPKQIAAIDKDLTSQKEILRFLILSSRQNINAIKKTKIKKEALQKVIKTKIIKKPAKIELPKRPEEKIVKSKPRVASIVAKPAHPCLAGLQLRGSDSRSREATSGAMVDKKALRGHVPATGSWRDKKKPKLIKKIEKKIIPPKKEMPKEIKQQEKPTDEQERMKKLEEKLDELLRE